MCESLILVQRQSKLFFEENEVGTGGWDVLL